MQASRRLSVAGLLLVVLAGCATDGGRGSSGFDVTENVIIDRVLDTQQCIGGQGLIYCPADQQAKTATPPAATPTPPPGATPSATANPLPRVDTGLANGAAIACTRTAAGAPCELVFSFAALGFPADASFRVAARLRAPDSAWRLSPPPMVDPSAGTPVLDTLVDIPVPADATAPQVQFAVLVFLTPPMSLPSEFDGLVDAGADFAFVTAELALETITTAPSPTPSPMPTPPAVSQTPTPSAATPTPTDPAAATGPIMTYFGIARADSVSLAPSGFDPDGRPIYIRPVGYALSLIIEGRPGTSARAVGPFAYDPNGGLPDLQLILSRPLGNGSTAVCDARPPTVGGVPAAVPFAFSAALPVIDAINDVGCRVDDGQGNPRARSADSACTLDRAGEFAFVDAATTAQFCLPIDAPWGFPSGDTIVAAQLRDVGGNVGPEREIVLRNAGFPPGTVTPTHPATSPSPLSSTPSTRTATAIPTFNSSTATPTPSATRPPSGSGPEITYFGLARADDVPVTPAGTDGSGRLVYESIEGQGVSLVIEARPGLQRLPLGTSAYTESGLPDLQVLVSRALGNGSAIVCDARPPVLGGVPATDPVLFTDDPAVIDAINDLGCRVDDGTGHPLARTANDQACTASNTTATSYAFVSDDSTVQYCLPIAAAWHFPRGDTIVAARVRDVRGNTSLTSEIIVRVGRP